MCKYELSLILIIVFLLTQQRLRHLLCLAGRRGYLYNELINNNDTLWLYRLWIVAHLSEILLYEGWMHSPIGEPSRDSGHNYEYLGLLLSLGRDQVEAVCDQCNALYTDWRLFGSRCRKLRFFLLKVRLLKNEKITDPRITASSLPTTRKANIDFNLCWSWAYLAKVNMHDRSTSNRGSVPSLLCTSRSTSFVPYTT